MVKKLKYEQGILFNRSSTQEAATKANFVLADKIAKGIVTNLYRMQNL